jgi:hypothetical protein
VLNIEPVNDVIWGANVLVFSIDVAVDFQTDTSWDCVSASGQQRHSVQWFAIPKANPAVGSSGDNPMYRDYANYVTLSLVTGKPIFMYVDTCVAGYPRVIFMNINN